MKQTLVPDERNDAYPTPGITVRDKGHVVQVFLGGWRVGSYKSARGVLDCIDRNREAGKEIAERVRKDAEARKTAEHHRHLRKFGDRMEVLKQDPHIREQVERLMPVLTSVFGHKEVRSYEEYVQNAAIMVARLELEPTLEFSGIYGGIAAARGPMQGYSILVWATDVYAMHLDHDHGTGSFEGLDHWHEGERARHARSGA